jgi:hypothetical protein
MAGTDWSTDAGSRGGRPLPWSLSLEIEMMFKPSRGCVRIGRNGIERPSLVNHVVTCRNDACDRMLQRRRGLRSTVIRIHGIGHRVCSTASPSNVALSTSQLIKSPWFTCTVCSVYTRSRNRRSSHSCTWLGLPRVWIGTMRSSYVDTESTVARVMVEWGMWSHFGLRIQCRLRM